MFPNGQSTEMNTIFSFLTMLVAIPSAIKMWNWLATMYKGSIDLRTPMCYSLSFLFRFAIGGLTGIFLGTLKCRYDHLHDTYFVIAHFHYVMFGGTIIMFVGAIHYWWPKMTGKMYSETLGRTACALIFIGFNTTFLPQFVMGTHGMSQAATPLTSRNSKSYHVVTSTIGAYIQFIGFLHRRRSSHPFALQRQKGTRRIPGVPPRLSGPAPSPPPHNNFNSARPPSAILMT